MENSQSLTENQDSVCIGERIPQNESLYRASEGSEVHAREPLLDHVSQVLDEGQSVMEAEPSLDRRSVDIGLEDSADGDSGLVKIVATNSHSDGDKREVDEPINCENNDVNGISRPSYKERSIWHRQ